MPKDILLAIINQRLFLLLLFIILEHYAVWCIMLKLGFRILDVQVEFKKILPGAFCLTVYSICSKQIFSPPMFFSGLMALFFLIFRIRTRWDFFF